ncbi:MAG TPA: hypothetical protein VK447_15405 [Myxococcaceae bacterium]|nr:hypothetical protein [Myxococcaceae bacterium]
MSSLLSGISFLALAQFPGVGNPRPNTPGALEPRYFEFLERNSHIIYPAIAVLVLVLLVAGIIQAWRTQDMDALDKVEFKRELISELRRTMGGATAEVLGRAVGLEPFRAQRLLEELQKDGIVLSHTNTSRLTVWRIKF